MRRSWMISALVFGVVFGGLALGDTPSRVLSSESQSVKSSDQSVAKNPPLPKDAPVSMEDMRLFFRVLRLTQRNTVEDVSEKDLVRKAIDGMLSKLDPHSSFLDETGVRTLEDQVQGEFGGLGIVISPQGGGVVVVAPIEDTPASRAGVRSGDLLFKVDGQLIDGLGIDKAVMLMRGKPGSRVELSVLRKGEDQPLTFKLKREIIKLQTVKGEILDHDYLYLRITSFGGKTRKELDDFLSKQKMKPSEYKGVLLDLRDDPGGLLDAAVSVSSAFLLGGKVVSIRGRQGGDFPPQVFQADSNPVFPSKTPVVVLINGGSASASEIVAGALQDRHRAIVVGTRSFGKGSVQTIIPVSAREAVRLTTALYYTPNDRSIQAKGIVPDVLIREGQFTPSKVEEEDRIYESSLSGHLSNPKSSAKPTQEGTETEGSFPDKDDHQLQEALGILKALSFKF